MIYKVKMPEAHARMEWCKEQFGGDGRPDYSKRVDIVRGMRWWRREGYLFFRYKKDYVWYQMRWFNGIQS